MCPLEWGMPPGIKTCLAGECLQVLAGANGLKIKPIPVHGCPGTHPLCIGDDQTAVVGGGEVGDGHTVSDGRLHQ